MIMQMNFIRQLSKNYWIEPCPSCGDKNLYLETEPGRTAFFKATNLCAVQCLTCDFAGPSETVRMAKYELSVTLREDRLTKLLEAWNERHAGYVSYSKEISTLSFEKNLFIKPRCPFCGNNDIFPMSCPAPGEYGLVLQIAWYECYHCGARSPISWGASDISEKELLAKSLKGWCRRAGEQVTGTPISTIEL